MDTKQIEYIIKIAEENNITRAAEKLHVTQPALNQQLLNLERELGLQLFHREKKNWHLTKAGEIYISNAKKMLEIKNETYKAIEEMSIEKSSMLSVAFTPGRGISMFTSVYPIFHEKYPDIIVEPHELSVRRQQLLISEGKLDIGFQTLCKNNKTNDEYIHIANEEILLVVHASKKEIYHPKAYYTEDSLYPIIDISLFKDESFVLMYKESTIRQMVDSIFRKANFEPDVLFETANNTTILAMIQNNLCCGLVPEYYLNDKPDDFLCYSLKDHPSWEIEASYKKGTRLSKYAKYFIELAANFY